MLNNFVFGVSTGNSKICFTLTRRNDLIGFYKTKGVFAQFFFTHFRILVAMLTVMERVGDTFVSW